MNPYEPYMGPAIMAAVFVFMFGFAVGMELGQNRDIVLEWLREKMAPEDEKESNG